MYIQSPIEDRVTEGSYRLCNDGILWLEGPDKSTAFAERVDFGETQPPKTTNEVVEKHRESLQDPSRSFPAINLRGLREVDPTLDGLYNNHVVLIFENGDTLGAMVDGPREKEQLHESQRYMTEQETSVEGEGIKTAPHPLTERALRCIREEYQRAIEGKAKNLSQAWAVVVGGVIGFSTLGAFYGIVEDGSLLAGFGQAMVAGMIAATIATPFINSKIKAREKKRLHSWIVD